MRLLFASIEWPFPDQPYRGAFAKHLADALQAHVEVIPFPLPIRRNPLNILRYRYELHKAYQKYGCDHLHCYSLHSLWMADPHKQSVSASAIGTDVFGSPDQKGLYPKGGSWTFRLLNASFKHLAGLRAVSESLKTKIQQKLPSSVPIEVIPDGLLVNHFAVKSRETACQNLGWDPNKIHVFFPGNPERPVKNFDMAQQLIGHAENQVNLDFHTFPGVSSEAMNDYYRAADVVLITSFHEGSSNALKEALLCNTPVLSTPVGDAPYWFSFDVNGCLIDFNITQEKFTELLKYYAYIKRGQQPGINQGIADELDLKLIASQFADFLKSLN